jgi:hypothetical protein
MLPPILPLPLFLFTNYDFMSAESFGEHHQITKETISRHLVSDDSGDHHAAVAAQSDADVGELVILDLRPRI